jgi:phage baseplate assembly protein W
MPAQDAQFGSDLRLLGDLTHQQGRARGSDLSVSPEDGATDLETLTGGDNLAQALLLRFLTPAGELAPLGHADYGSRLYELIGELNTETTRNRIKMLVLQMLAAEPRVREVVELRVTQAPAEPTRVDVAMTLAPIEGDTLLNLVFPFSLAGGGVT